MHVVIGREEQIKKDMGTKWVDKKNSDMSDLANSAGKSVLFSECK